MVAKWARPVTGTVLMAGQSESNRMTLPLDADLGPLFHDCDWTLVQSNSPADAPLYAFRSLADPGVMAGTSLYADWQPVTGTGMYEELVAIARTVNSDRKNVLWWDHGQNDAGTSLAIADAYGTNFLAWYASFLSDSGHTTTSMPVMLTYLHSSSAMTWAANVRSIQEALVSTYSHIHGFSVDALTLDASNIHVIEADRPAKGLLASAAILTALGL